MSEFYKKLAKRIKDLRNQYGLSQSNVAEKLGISRVSFTKIEKGERKISADEIKKLAEIFNLSIDALINSEKDLKIEFDNETAPQKGKTDLRISVPQKNIKKFKEVFLYILNKVGSKPNIGESVIYKLLYFIDFNYYEKYEEQLIGATYIKNHYGPTPKEFVKVVKDMENNKEVVKIKNNYFKYPQRKYLPLRIPDLSVLSAREIKTIDEVLEKLSDKNAKQISEYSHKDVPWIITEKGRVIKYESVFYRTPEYSVRNYEEDI